MSTSGQGGAGGDRRQQGFSKFIRRASKVLRPRSTPPTATESLQASETATSSRPRPESIAVTPAPKKPAPTPKAASTPKATTTPKSTPLPKVDVQRPSDNAIAYSKLREDKARALFAKYGYTLEQGEWTRPVTGQVEWIEKKVVMRVHRQCHRCQSTFGSEKVCSNCSHTRCKKCPRFPSKRPKDPGHVRVDNDPEARADSQPLTLLTKHGKEHVRRHPVHRVRRTCHKCSTLFAGKATQCENCKHQRCPQCPREPPKSDKWPEGYPGDVPETFPLAERRYRPARTRYRWECHACNKAFIEHETVCRGCQHERCDDCPRRPPKKVKAEPHPDVIRSVEEKMGQIGLSPAA